MRLTLFLCVLLGFLATAYAGVTIDVLQKGDETNYPKSGDRIKVHYTGTLTDGTKFDSSVDRGQPFETVIGVGRVIKCWDEGMLQMSVGERAVLHCTSDVAYGARGAGRVIPPNADLDFEVELLEILN